jgi:EF-P beta-lysylation protein EpmB
MITRIEQILQPSDWQTELKNVFTDLKQLCQYLELPVESLYQAFPAQQLFPLKVTQHYADQIKKGDIKDPLLRQVILSAHELEMVSGYSTDPVDEHQTAIPGLIHKYPHRVLLIVTQACAIHCRYCFRRAFPYQQNNPGRQAWQQAFDYIEKQNIKEVILSGGDPLVVDDKHLQFFFDALNKIPSVKRIRLHSRIPAVLPSRITPKLLQLLSSSEAKVCMVYHINHANEISDEVRQGARALSQVGVHLLNQSVLLRGVNDQVSLLAELSEALVDCGIQPYYLHVLDKVVGSHHFNVPDEEALALIEQLRQQESGYLVPQLVREVAGKASKIPVDKIA